MNTVTKASEKFKLSRKNQKGQVAIFVALIFQVVFVFFALLINVGLLVHHKINLQQSTDLAAYYGAMKQAESLNAIAHINFQMRQTWKLLTWRYRVLGTFGFQAEPSGISQKFPFQPLGGNNYTYNAEVDSKCTAPPVLNLGVQDIPFFCVGHGGFTGWVAPGDTSCRISCNTFSQAKQVKSIPTIGGVSLPFGGSTGPAIDALINTANLTNTMICNDLSKFGGTTIARFLAAYLQETVQRKATIEMLAGNLSASVDKQLDLDGGSVFAGSKKTFENNLTEANLAGVKPLVAINGLSQGDCAYENGRPNNTRKEFLKKIEFEFINYFIHHCSTTDGQRYQPRNLFTPDNKASTGFGLTADVRSVLEAVFNDETKHTIGFEKNPNCVEYYGVKASATPKIPFLPIEAVQLNAVSIFKPFGGSVGPWFGKEWKGTDHISSYEDAVPTTKTDQSMPLRQPPDASSIDEIVGSIRQQPNFSLFVGDTIGIRDSRYIAAYHAILSQKVIPTAGFTLTNAWPAYSDWTGIENVTNPESYDSLAKLGSPTRAVEITALVPNQFDLTYYSIDPDFYGNYFVKIHKNFDALKSAANGKGPPDRRHLRPDFGAQIDATLLSQNPIPDRPPLDVAMFSVKDQILVKNLIFNGSPSGHSAPAPSKYSDHFPFLATAQSNLLTSWTFLSFTDFKKFPEGPLSNSETMSFAKCSDEWNKDDDILSSNNFRTPKSIKAGLPPATGNCVTGGRSGYSVKMITPSVVGAIQPNGQTVLNPLPPGWISF